jgi:hypothetical protein
MASPVHGGLRVRALERRKRLLTLEGRSAEVRPGAVRSPGRETPEGKYLGYDFFGLRKELREALGRKVDVHTPPNADSTPSVAAFIRRHQALIYDATDAE